VFLTTQSLAHIKANPVGKSSDITIKNFKTGENTTW